MAELLDELGGDGGVRNCKTDVSQAVELLNSYEVYKKQFFAEQYAKTFFNPNDSFKALSEEPQKKMEEIENLIKSFAPSNMATLLNLHYINGIPIDKCAECMVMSRASTFRLLKRAHVAVNNRYQRMKGTTKLI